MKKRLLSFLLTLVMVLGILPVTAFADVGKFTDPAIGYIDVTDPDNLGRAVTDGNGHYVDTFAYAAKKEGYIWLEKITLDSARAWSTEGATNPAYTVDKVEGTRYVDKYWLSYENDGQNLGEYAGEYVNINLEFIKLYDIKNQCYVEPTTSAWLILDPDNDALSGGDVVPVGMYAQEYCYDVWTDLYVEAYVPMWVGFPSGCENMTVTMDGQTLKPRSEAWTESLGNHTPGMYWVMGGGTAGSSTQTTYPCIARTLYVNSPVRYVYDVKPEINSVKVNGTSVADGGTFTANSGIVTVKTTYDSTLSQALTDYGCTVKELSAYYLNGEKINVAMITPVSNGDGTSTKTYSRTLNTGDELTVKSWLEITWPNGYKDRVDEHTMTIKAPEPQFTTQPAGGRVGYNERHIVNWATNFDSVKQELVRYSSADSVVQIQGLDAGAFQASLPYMTSGYYYRIRAYYDYYDDAYVESDKIYVTPDQYFGPNPQYGNTEEDIIEGITYVPNGDGTFNAHVHVNLNCVDGQMLQHEWVGTGYCWYDHNNTPHYGSVGVDTNKFTFTLDNLGKDLEPGKEWKVKVYLADDYYADWEWQGYSFNYFTDTVPEFKAHTCADSNNDYKCDICGAELEKPEDPEQPEQPVIEDVIRLAGANRWATSLMVADEMKANLGIEKFGAIIVASGNDFADALAGSYLSTVKNAPILLGWGKGGKYVTLDEANIAYIKANLAPGGTVYILGGKNAVPELYETSLSGINVKRLGGANRFETNLLILEEAGVPAGSEVLVCTSTNFADSLSASATGKPILLVFNEYGKLYGKQPEYLAKLQNCTFTVIGGESAVSAKLADAIKTYGNVTRLAGANRFETSVLVAQKYFTAPATAVLAYAWNYPDGLCGGSLAYSMKAPLILTMTKYEAKAVEYATGAGIESGVVLGGDGLISDASVRAIFAMAESDQIILKK